MVEFVKGKEPEQPYYGRTGDNFISDLCYIMMYRMILGAGSDKLEKSIQLDENTHIAHTTIGRNLELLLPILRDWAYIKVSPGTEEDWKKAVQNSQFPEPFSDVNLWMDSSDIPVQRTEEIRETDDWYSFKLKGAGIRVQFIADGMQRVRYIKGPCSPKQFDGDFLDLFHLEIEEKFKKGKIIADNHYLKGPDIFPQGPTFYVNERESPADKVVGDKENLPIHCPNKKRKKNIDYDALTEEQKLSSIKKLKNNDTHSHVRGRIEGIFGNMKRKFALLSGRHVDKRVTLYWYVVIASAINNMILDKNNGIA